jgi:hypothetical protein
MEEIGAAMKNTLLVGLMSLCAVSASGWTGDACGQKLIGHGWDIMCAGPKEILDNAESFGKLGLDGVAVAVRGMEKGKYSWRYMYSLITVDKPWPRELLEDDVKLLKEYGKHPGLKDSLLIFWISPPRRLSWTDDAAWERFAHNVGELAWMGRESGLPGYIVDSEDYHNQRQYFYNPDIDGMTYEEACKVARKRGAQVFSSLFANHRNAVLLSFWFMSEAERYYAHARSPVHEAKRRKDLWPSFVNGILDVLPEEAKFVDGNEHAYRGEAVDNEFYVKAFNQRHGLLGLVAPENRAKYKAMLSVGFGLYLDSYTNEKGFNSWYYGPAEDGSRLTHFERNFEQAARVSTEYVWIYGERRCWVDWKKTPKSNIWKTKRFVDMMSLPKPTWEKSLPGLSEVFLSVKDPDAFRDGKISEMKRLGTYKNLVSDGECKGQGNLKPGCFNANRIPHGYSTWKSQTATNVVYGIDTSVGDGDSSSIAMKGGPFGNVSAIIPVMWGESYAVSVSVRSPKAAAEACWMVDGKWKWTESIHFKFSEPDANGWRRALVTVRIPKGADKLGLIANAKLSDGETAWFDNFSIVKIR